MNRWIVVLLTLLALLPAPARAQGPEDEVLLVPVGQRVDGPIATFTQPIEVRGEVLGDVTSWGGTIRVRGHITGDVVSYIGHVLIEPGALVDGHVLSLAGAVVPVDGAQVSGEAIGDSIGGGAVASLLGLLRTQRADPVATAVARTGFSFTFLLLVLATATIGSLMWPQRTRTASDTLRRLPGRSLAVGLLTNALVAVLLPLLATLLALTLVGLPLLPVLLIILQAPYIFGIAALGQALGRPLAPAAPERATALGVLALLLTPMLLAPFAPLIALGVFYILAGTGLGGVILSGGGTRAFAPLP